MKVCKQCGINKKNNEYYKGKNVCKVCFSERERLRYHARIIAMKTQRNKKLKCGITTEAWNNMYVQQGGCCKICNKAIAIIDTHTDHNHHTGKVRGILCKTCNMGIGLLQDSPRILKSALKYLENEGFYGEA